MPSISPGSVATSLTSAIVPMPSGISGILNTIVENQRMFIEQFTGDTIGSVYAEKYQSAIYDLSTSNVVKLMALQDMGAQTVWIEGLKTDNNNLMEMAKQFEDRGMQQLKWLVKGMKLYRARG